MATKLQVGILSDVNLWEKTFGSKTSCPSLATYPLFNFDLYIQCTILSQNVCGKNCHKTLFNPIMSGVLLTVVGWEIYRHT